MRESELLQHIYARSAATGPFESVRVGPGDDCAVLRVAEGADVLVTSDQLIEGRHYEPGTPAERIAWKCLARAISDIAAMAGSPLGAVVAAAMPSGFEGADELFDAMHRAAAQFGCPLIGGDIASTTGPAVLTATILGVPHAARGPVLRSTAEPGDAVWVTGSLGGAWRTTRGDGAGGSEPPRASTFTPRVREGAAIADRLGGKLRSMIDLSDGLGIDAGRVAAASGVRIELDASALPLAPGAADWRQALGDGEDYELAFTTPDEPGVAATLDALATEMGVAITRVGIAVVGNGCVVRTSGGETLDASSMGWDHA